MMDDELGMYNPNYMDCCTLDGPPTVVEDTMMPRILLMGLKRAGKSSIFKVVFRKMSPEETLELERTRKITKYDVLKNLKIQFQIWDFPGGKLDFLDPESHDLHAMFCGNVALVFVIDATDDLTDSIDAFIKIVSTAHNVNSKIKLEVFIHKLDNSLHDPNQIEKTENDVKDQIRDELNYLGHSDISVSYHTTSIYDDLSVTEALSNIVKKVSLYYKETEKLLDRLLDCCNMERTLLFDIHSNLCIASDSSPLNSYLFEICTNIIDLHVGMASIYGREGLLDSADGDNDDKSFAISRLSNGCVIYLRQINHFLAIICIISDASFEKKALIDINISIIQKAIKDVIELKTKAMKKQHQHQLSSDSFSN